MNRTALAHTGFLWPLFTFVELPTEKSKPCVKCGSPIRESYTPEKLPVLINSQAKPYFLSERDGHRFGKFATTEVHTHAE